MLPQFGFSEFLLLAAAALIVVGPKDLPLLMRRVGQMVAKARATVAEFQGAFDDLARQAELDALKEEIASLKENNPVAQAAEELRKAEADINASVMRRAPREEASKPAQGGDTEP